MRINTMQSHLNEPVDSFELEGLIDSKPRTWRLEVANPVGQGVSTFTRGETFNRRTHPNERDFRWIIDLESDEFYGEDLTEKIDTTLLGPILQIPHGEFYSSSKGPPLVRSKAGGEFETFGSIAAGVGCDITLQGDEVALVVDETNEEIFRFKKERGVSYEFVNTPPTDDEHASHHHHGATSHDHAGNAQSDVSPEVRKAEEKDHFQHYYHLFTSPVEKFVFEELKTGAAAPAPRPQLCGTIILGKRKSPLT